MRAPGGGADCGRGGCGPRVWPPTGPCCVAAGAPRSTLGTIKDLGRASFAVHAVGGRGGGTDAASAALPADRTAGPPILLAAGPDGPLLPCAEPPPCWLEAAVAQLAGSAEGVVALALPPTAAAFAAPEVAAATAVPGAVGAADSCPLVSASCTADAALGTATLGLAGGDVCVAAVVGLSSLQHEHSPPTAAEVEAAPSIEGWLPPTAAVGVAEADDGAASAGAWPLSTLKPGLVGATPSESFSLLIEFLTRAAQFVGPF